MNKSILKQLSSQVGDRSEYSNRKVALQCLDDPELLTEIAACLQANDAALLGDCTEVLTQVAQEHPDWVSPYAADLVPLLEHKTSRVRWEAMHSLALVAALTPGTIAPILPRLDELILTDASVIVRDQATDAVGNYASTGVDAAEQAFPLLKDALYAWNGKQAHHGLRGMLHVARLLPARRAELRLIAEEFSHSGRGVVRKAAKDLLKALGELSN